MRTNRRKLSRGLTMSILLMTAPIFILSIGILYLQSRYLIHQEVSEDTQSMLHTMMQRIKYYINTVETAANSNVWLLEESFTPDSIRSVPYRTKRLNHNVTSCEVITDSKILSNYEHNHPKYTVNKDGTVGTYSCPIIMKDGHLAGILSTNFSFSRMAGILNEFEHPYPHSYYMMLAGDGRYIMHPDSTKLFKKTIFTDSDPSNGKDMIALGHEMTAGNRGNMHVMYNGQRYHVDYSPVPGTDWSLALVCLDKDIMKNYHQLGYAIIGLLVIGISIILLLCHHMVKRTIYPINMLIATTRKMADGQYDETIPTTNDKNVIGRLQNCFAMMQQSLNERMSSLRQHVDDLRLHNEELMRARQQTEEIIKRKNQYICHLTQQMRMPLNVITGFADILGDSTNTISGEEQSSIRQMMMSNVDGMNRMILLMLDATETDTNEKLVCERHDELSCMEIAQTCIQHTLTHYPQANIQLENELSKDIFILTNKIYLTRILFELLDNAASHSDGKHITLRISQTEDNILFTVQDVGPGLPADFAEQTYKPFTKADELPEGVGMGLALVKRHALSLGGNMHIDTDYNNGCRITIEMPK